MADVDDINTKNHGPTSKLRLLTINSMI